MSTDLSVYSSPTRRVLLCLGQAPSVFFQPGMAPITDDTVEALRDTIRKLESRVQQLEVKLGHKDASDSPGSSKRTLQSVRMILMGPPGAGKSQLSKKIPRPLAYVLIRQGNTGTEDQGQILCLPSGESHRCQVHGPTSNAYGLS